MNVDPAQDLLALEAVFRIQMGEEDEAIRLIRTYLTTNPEHRAGWQLTSHWWYREIRDNAEFQQLVVREGVHRSTFWILADSSSTVGPRAANQGAIDGMIVTACEAACRSMS